MLNVNIFIGSPRKKGNTSVLSDFLVNELDKNKFKVKIYFLYDFEINPCIDCRACKKNKLECALRDEMQILYKIIEDSDILIFGTPIYWFGPTATTKLFIDRLRPYYVNKKMAGKKAALLLTAGSGASDCDLTIELFKRTFTCLEIDFLGEVSAKGYDAGEVKSDFDAINSINKLGEYINNLSKA